MVGMDIADTIVVRRSVEKGTKIISEPVKKLNNCIGKKVEKQGLGIFWGGAGFSKTAVVI